MIDLQYIFKSYWQNARTVRRTWDIEFCCVAFVMMINFGRYTRTCTCTAAFWITFQTCNMNARQFYMSTLELDSKYVHNSTTHAWFDLELPIKKLLSAAMSSTSSQRNAFCMSPISPFSVPASTLTQRGTPGIIRVHTCIFLYLACSSMMIIITA